MALPGLTPSRGSVASSELTCCPWVAWAIGLSWRTLLAVRAVSRQLRSDDDKSMSLESTD
jgi:hypothetical protein